MALGVLIACVVLAFTAPIPSPTEVREMAVAAGPAAPLVFFCVYAVCVALPLPRTAFNLASGLLLGNVLGIGVALAATMASGALGYALARPVGTRLFHRHLDHDAVRAVDAKLTGGGVLGVASLRLIPVIPFAPMSYCCGLSSIPLRPYLLGTALGSVPGTAAVVVLGDALTGQTPPTLIACYAAFALIGGVGVYRIVRRPASPAAMRVTPDGLTATRPSE
ncbi:TVP38/TMEM64 family protein [Haloechinothrix salitolerans]